MFHHLFSFYKQRSMYAYAWTVPNATTTALLVTVQAAAGTSCDTLRTRPPAVACAAREPTPAPTVAASTE